MKWNAIAMIAVLGLAGCSTRSPSPDTIRQSTAKATAEAARNTKAVVQGIFDGLRAKGPLNINRATNDQLASLPGIDAAAAERIVAGRPYKNSAELLQRRILSKKQYNRIANQVTTR